MTLLILFAAIAGAATALSPCVLPILPAILAGGVTGGRRRPLGVATGLVVSFTFSTVALIYLLDALGLPDDLARNLAIAGLLIFGLFLLLPAISDRFEAWVSSFTGRIPLPESGDGFGSGAALGFVLGFVYAPCAGPILGAVATASASRPFGIEKLLVALAYAIGSGVVIYGLMVGGRKLATRLRPVQSRVNLAMGAIMIVFAVALATDLDLKFQRFLAQDAPTIIATPTEAIEDSDAFRDELASLNEDDAAVNPIEQGPAGTAETEAEGAATAGASESPRPSNLPVYGVAPDFQDAGKWFNSEPLSIPGLRGKVVLIDFWTYTCINCLRTLPHVTAWDERYRDKGLVVVGVHTPEFAFERESSNVESAISDDDIGYPVVQDNDYGTWNAWGNRYWPAKYLIDAQGRVRYYHFGEGDYDKTEQAIRSLLAESGSQGLGGRTNVTGEEPSQTTTTPELYLGALRDEAFAEPLRPGTRSYSAPDEVLPDTMALDGRWRSDGEAATAAGGSSLELEFGAKRVFLVLGPEEDGGKGGAVRVLLDGKPIPVEVAGRDVKNGVVQVTEQDLFDLVDLPKVERHRLTLEFDPGVAGYAFTFG